MRTLTKTLAAGNRAIDEHGQACSVIRIEDKIAYVLYDYQRPSSNPKPRPIHLLTVISNH